MEYIELNFTVEPKDVANEILIAELAEIGFESFEETDNGLKSFIQKPDFSVEAVDNLFVMQAEAFNIVYKVNYIEDQNWNAVWEENYPPVVIENRVAIRAPFHKPFNTEFEIEIEPKMSFGTAHHPTTAQMIKLILNNEIKDLDILDMGSGTAVLAILASLRGANHVNAIDNDEWAYNNALENVQRNNIDNIKVELGDAALLDGRKYDLVIANINRNILLNDLKHYAKCMSKGNLLFLSGFYESDIEKLSTEALKHGLEYQHHGVDNMWVAGVWKMS
ncbi:MAG: 50S ribosomal protein L11 methyltransferase [Bacteroidetes bacterium]|nr:MAG: 50S ribosomal protein L11 methyltransferase [Bacteroidota bacterium]